MEHERSRCTDVPMFGAKESQGRNRNDRARVVEGEVEGERTKKIVEVDAVAYGPANGLEKNVNMGRSLLGGQVQPMTKAKRGHLINLSTERPVDFFRWWLVWRLRGYGRRLPRRRWRRLLALRRSGAQVSASQVAVGHAPSNDIGQDAHEPRAVVTLALVEAAHLLVNIPEQMERVNGNVGAFDRSLQERPEVFQAVGVDLPPGVLPRMIDRLMLIKGAQPFGGRVLVTGVGVEMCPPL